MTGVLSPQVPNYGEFRTLVLRQCPLITGCPLVGVSLEDRFYCNTTVYVVGGWMSYVVGGWMSYVVGGWMSCVF